jgi:NADH-quinone oxidoreductase subunit H
MGLKQLADALLGELWSRVLTELAVAAIVLGFFLLSSIFPVWLERKLSGRMQSRFGPIHVGAFHGWLQTLADGIKLFFKEDVVPTAADKVLHTVAPLIVLWSGLTAFVVIPFGNEMVPRDFNIGLVYLLAVTSVSVFGVVMAGWSSGNKYSLLGGMRSGAQFVSYEIPRALALIGVIMLAGTLQMGDIVNQQSGIVLDADGGVTGGPAIPFVLLQPIAFVLYMIASIAETNRTPFDLPEAESELVAGFHTEYSGMKFAFFFMAEYANMLLFCCLATALFLGGGSIPLVEGPLYEYTSNQLFDGKLEFLRGFWHFPLFVLKTYLLVFVFMWVRWTYPRLRVDRLMDFAWKILVPWAFANLILLGLAMVYRPEGGVVIFALANWAIVGYVLRKALKG